MTDQDTIERIAIDSNFAYLIDGGNEFQIIDISNKKNPEFKGSCLIPNNGFNLYVKNYFAYVVDVNRTLYIIDITDKDAPFITASMEISDFDTISDIFVDSDNIYLTCHKNDENGKIIQSGFIVIEIDI